MIICAGALKGGVPMIPISKPAIGEAEKQAVLEVLESGMLVQGPRTARLEEKFASVCGVKHAIGTSSGTSALHLALLANGIGPGDEVITSPFTFIASINSILYCGARPVFVDIEEDSFNINPALMEQAVTPSTKALMPVHLYGYPCDMAPIMEMAGRHKLAVIEDAAQAIGAEYQGQRVGSFGAGCFSLYATKNVMSGEGGMITTNDEVIAEKCRMLRNHGMRRRYYHEILGYNYRLSDLHAAIGLAQLERLEEFSTRRQANAAYLTAHLRSVRTPTVKAGYRHVWHQYTVRIKKDRDLAVQRLSEAGVGTGIFYPVTANKQEYLAKLGYAKQSFPVAEAMAQQVLSLPVHPSLSPADLEVIVAEVNKL
jgi:perosamine synthetase